MNEEFYLSCLASKKKIEEEDPHYLDFIFPQLIGCIVGFLKKESVGWFPRAVEVSCNIFPYIEYDDRDCWTKLESEKYIRLIVEGWAKRKKRKGIDENNRVSNHVDRR